MLKTLKFMLILSCLLLVMTTGQALANPSAQTGTVIETMNSGGYTYLHLENNGMQSWAAIPSTVVKVGDQVTVGNGMVMTNFTSSTLGRTFPTIVFSKGLVK